VNIVAVFLVRLAVFILVVVAIAIGLVPILVLIDLLDGGTGWGLCPGGIDVCDKPYSTGAELIIILSLGLFFTVLGIRLLMRLARRLQDDTYQVSQ
jgi:amino acid transporter